MKEQAMFTSLPDLDQHAIAAPFRARITPNMTQQDKDALQAEYTAATEQAKKDLVKARQTVADQNTAAFLANPKQGVEALSGSSCLTIGELLQCYGVGTVKSTRQGKGVLIGKGTLGEGTISQFKVAARIGDKGLIQECGSRNDRRSKEDMEAMVLTRLARLLASGNFGTPSLDL
jgi:hypothetical protein